MSRSINLKIGPQITGINFNLNIDGNDIILVNNLCLDMVDYIREDKATRQQDEFGEAFFHRLIIALYALKVILRRHDNFLETIAASARPHPRIFSPAAAGLISVSHPGTQQIFCKKIDTPELESFLESMEIAHRYISFREGLSKQAVIEGCELSAENILAKRIDWDYDAWQQLVRESEQLLLENYLSQLNQLYDFSSDAPPSDAASDICVGGFCTIS